MPGRPPQPVLPLPRQWNKRVRRAVLHAISLAQVRFSGPASFRGKCVLGRGQKPRSNSVDQHTTCQGSGRCQLCAGAGRLHPSP